MGVTREEGSAQTSAIEVFGTERQVRRRVRPFGGAVAILGLCFFVWLTGCTTPPPDTSPPVGIGAPTISGSVTVGSTLSASNGSWNHGPTSFAVQWRRCTTTSACADIAGATTNSYAVTDADIGKGLQVAVTATNAYGSATQSSATTTLVPQPGPMIMSVSPPSGAAQGGSVATITGKYLTGVTVVRFDGVASPTIRVDSDTQVTAVAPAHNPATVDVTASNTYGTSVTGSATKFTYTSAGPAGCTINWTGAAADLKWETPGNWNLNRVPGVLDTACLIPAGPSTGLNPITLSASTAVAQVIAQLPFQISGQLTLGAGTSTFDNTFLFGRVDGPGAVVVSGQLSWSGGTISGSGGFTVPAGGRLRCDSGGNYCLLDRSLVNQGTVTALGYGFQIPAGRSLVNQGVFEVGSQITGVCCTGGWSWGSESPWV